MDSYLISRVSLINGLGQVTVTAGSTGTSAEEADRIASFLLGR
jgi:hypothetical protein